MFEAMFLFEGASGLKFEDRCELYFTKCASFLFIEYLLSMFLYECLSVCMYVFML